MSGLSLNAAENAEFVSKEGRFILLRIASGHGSLFTPTAKSRIELALSDYFSETIQIKLQNSDSLCATPALERKIAQDKKLSDAEASLQNDQFFQQLQQEFSAEVIKNSIMPSKNNL